MASLKSKIVFIIFKILFIIDNFTISTKKDMHTSLRSIFPLKKIENFNDLPHLKWEAALFFFSLGTVGVLAGASQGFYKKDPWASPNWDGNILDYSYILAVIILFLFTAKIGIKQWNYYYETKGEGKKDGIFIEKLKQVNPRDKTLDAILSLNGGVLVFFTTMPVLWFFILFVYSLLVGYRCLTIVRRKQYKNILISKGHVDVVSSWYDETLDHEYNGLTVKHVLYGWIISHILIGISAIFIFIMFYHNFFIMDDIIFKVISQDMQFPLLCDLCFFYYHYYWYSYFILNFPNIL